MNVLASFLDRLLKTAFGLPLWSEIIEMKHVPDEREVKALIAELNADR